ncbi:hypothetical protein EH30_04530 [Erythrobacter sp. JL475]|nr:hypothetical protein EH30_04530 [Erythrobacter sp. JL475]
MHKMKVPKSLPLIIFLILFPPGCPFRREALAKGELTECGQAVHEGKPLILDPGLPESDMKTHGISPSGDQKPPGDYLGKFM